MLWGFMQAGALKDRRVNALTFLRSSRSNVLMAGREREADSPKAWWSRAGLFTQKAKKKFPTLFLSFPTFLLVNDYEI